MSDTALDIRLRLYSTAGVKGRVLKTLSIDITDAYSDASTIRFTVSEKVAGSLEQPFVVALEYTVGSVWVEPPNARFVASNDDGNAVDPAGVVTFTGAGFWPWMLAHTHLHWAASSNNNVRTWTDQNPGYILGGMLDESFARGWGELSGTPFLSYDFTDTVDSNGVAWPAESKTTADYNLWTPLPQILNGLVADGLCEYSFDGSVLHLYVAGSGTDHTDVANGLVRLGPGAKSAPVKSSFDGVFTNLTVIPEKARYVTYLTNTGADSSFGRLEATLTLSGIGDDVPLVTKLAGPTLELGKASKRELSITYEGSSRFVPWRDFVAGDMVQVRTKSGWEDLRLVQLVVSKSTEGVVSWTAVTSYRFRSLLSKVANRQGNATVGSVAGGSGIPLTPDILSAALPKAPTGLDDTSNTGVWDEAGNAKADVTLGWDAVTQATDDSLIDIKQYEVWIRLTGGSSAGRFTTAGTSLDLDLLEPDTDYLVKVRAQAFSLEWSEFSTEITVSTGHPSAVLPAPSDPVLTSKLGVVSVQWDGLLSTGAPPAQFRSVYVAMSTTELGTYTAAGTPMGHAGATQVTDLTRGSIYWFKLFPVDSQGVTGTGSAAVSIEVVGVDGPDLEANSVTANKVAVGLLEAMQIELGQRNPFGQATDRVPTPVTDDAWWSPVLAGTVPLLTPPVGLDFNLAAASSSGLVLSPSSSADARCWVTARLPVPSARALNVAFLADNAATATLQNEHVSPLPGLDDTGYEVLSDGGGQTFSVTVSTTGGVSGTGYWRATGSGANFGAAGLLLGPALDVSLGEVVTLAGWMRCSAAVTAEMATRTFTGAGGTGTGVTYAGTDFALTADTWTFISVTFTAPSGIASIRPYVRLRDAGAVQAARTFDFDQLSLATGTVTADFTGNTDNAGTHKYVWDGAVGSSTSTRTTITAGARVSTWDAGGTVTTSDPLWSGEVWPFPDDAVDYAVHLFWPEDGAATTFSMAHVFEAIGNAGDGQYVRITPQGFESVDPGGGVSTRLGTWDDNALSIDQFNEFGQAIPQARINTDGVISGNQVETVEYYVNGIAIVGEAESARINGVPLSVPLLERGPRGEQFSTGLGTDATSFGELALQVVGSTAVQVLGAAKLQLNPGRRYDASLDATLLSRWESASPTNTGQLWLELWIGDTAQDASAPNGVKRRWALMNGADTTYPSLTRIPISPCASFDAPADADGFSYILLRVLRVSSSTSYRVQAWGTSDETNEPILILRDVGSSEVDPFVATTKVRTTTGTPSTPGSVVTVQVACSFSQSWGSTPSTIYTASGDKFADGRMLHQGQPGRSKMAIFGWPDLGLSSETLIAARVLMRPRFISKSTGATVQFGTSAYSSPPAISKPAVANRWDVHTANPGSPRWFDIPLDDLPGLATAIVSNTVRSLTLGEPTGGSEETNVIFDGFYPTNSCGSSLVPLFEFTYRV